MRQRGEKKEEREEVKGDTCVAERVEPEWMNE